LRLRKGTLKDFLAPVFDRNKKEIRAINEIFCRKQKDSDVGFSQPCHKDCGPGQDCSQVKHAASA
jgi:hypothetical protein